MSLPSLAMSLSASACITRSRPSSMSISETRAASSASDCMRRRIRTGTKLLEPPPMIVTFGPIETSVHRVVAHGQDRRLEHAVRAGPRDRVHDGVGDLLGAHHALEVGVAGGGAAAL